MPVLQVQKPLPVCPQGIHTFRLVEVKPSFSEKFQTDQLMWRFVSNKRSPEGDLYEVPVWTGLAYGNPKAKLTWLLDMLEPGIVPEQADGLDTDVYLHREYEGSVKHQRKQDGSGMFATFAYLRPVQDTRPAPTADDGENDPFALEDAGAVDACEECGKELTPAEIKACVKRWGNAMRLCTKHGKEALAHERVDAQNGVAAGV